MRRFTIAKRILLGFCLFIGTGAIFGSVSMLIAPDGSVLGMQSLLPYFQVLPFASVLFQDYTFSGIALLVVNGLTNLTAAYLLIRKKPLGIRLGGLFGVTLMLWITIQFIIFPANFLSTTYFILGALQAATGYACIVFERQVNFVVQNEDDPRIGQNPKALVVYFSRLGRVKQIAVDTARASGAELFELQTAERTEGTLGFWWCGRFAMHGWEMPLRAMPDLERYDRVTICAPVWAFGICAPVRAFCRLAKGRIRRPELVLVHFQPVRYRGIARAVETMLGAPLAGFRSIRCQLGVCRTLENDGQ